MSLITHKQISELAQAEGLTLFTLTDLTPLKKAEKYLKIWQEAGCPAEMAYMLREASEMSHPAGLLPWAKTALVLLAPYRGDPPVPLPRGFGRVARYAWGRDYHRVLKKAMARLAVAIQDVIGTGFQWKGFSDAVPLTERALAERAGAGFIGRNSMLIRPGMGSYLLISEMFLDFEVAVSDIGHADGKGHCGKCTRCISSCPNSCISQVEDEGGQYRLDARNCISWLTIEKRGVFSPDQGRKTGEWLFGCDLCQECCPFNHALHRRKGYRPLKELSGSDVAAGFIELGPLLEVRTREAFLELYAGRPLMRPGREGMLRNAAFVAANTGARELLPVMMKAAREDSSPIVRESCRMAIALLNDERLYDQKHSIAD